MVQTPKGWPQDVRYLHTSSFSKTLTKDILDALNAKPASQTALRTVNGPSPNVTIRAINDSRHPANGQYGLFASKHLAPDSFVLFYIGHVHGEQDSDMTSDYDLALHRDLGIGVDASKAGNEARFINDYRGVTEKGPNAEFREAWGDLGNGRFERRMGVFVLPAVKSGRRAGGIKKGEEILVSYGKGFWKERKTGEDGP